MEEYQQDDAGMQTASKFVRVEFDDAGLALFANNVLVQRDDATIHLVFYQMIPPMILENTEEARKEALERIESIKARPVVRVAIPRRQLEQLIKAMSAHL